jgi:hypothetical protein
VSLGVNVAVIRDVPAPATVAEVPFIEITEVVPEEYDHVPAVDEVGGVKLNALVPYILERSLKLLKVGVALLIVIAVDEELTAK